MDNLNGEVRNLLLTDDAVSKMSQKRVSQRCSPSSKYSKYSKAGKTMSGVEGLKHHYDQSSFIKG
jgi:hypothetical protein